MLIYMTYYVQIIFKAYVIWWNKIVQAWFSLISLANGTFQFFAVISSVENM